ncbi:hypothetical protein D3C81_1655450 [compost metagenome]
MNRQAQLFLHFPDNGIGTSFAKLDTATDGAVEGSLVFVVVELVDQDLAVMMKDTEGERADAMFGQRWNSFSVLDKSVLKWQ